ncbi:MAG: gliding motility-associated C-terminal domain-containing protein [Sediminibacterium sp.]
MHKHLVLINFLLFLLLGYTTDTQGQACAISEFAKQYTGQESQIVVKPVLTKEKELLNLGNINYLQSGKVHNDGWVSLFTKSGSAIWSKRYSIPGYDLLHFNDMIAASDTSYLITGTIQTYWGVTDPAPPNPNWGILMMIDRYGNILWTKKMDQGFVSGVESTFLQNVLKASNGDFLASAVAWKNSPLSTKSIILRIEPNGNIVWQSIANSSVFEFKYNLSNQLIQSNDGKEIISAGIMDQRLLNRDSILKVNYYFSSLDFATGKFKWERTLNIRRQASNVFFNEGTVRQIQQLPNGDLSFLGFADTNYLMIPPITTKAVNMITSSTGVIKNIIGYQTSDKGSFMVDAKTDLLGNRQVLIQDGSQAIIASINDQGTVLKQKAFLTNSGAQSASSLIMGNDGYYIFLNNPISQQNSNLYKTDTAANLSCMSTTTSLNSFDASSWLFADDPAMTHTNELNPTNSFSSTTAASKDYPLTITTTCTNACCKDVIDTVNIIKVSICETDNYKLPDQVPVRISGTYYVSFKTALGCDSIKIYQVTVFKDPSVIQLGADTCLEGRDSIVLYTAPGFDQYLWNNIPSNNFYYAAKQAGTYTVKVSNLCGSKTATVNLNALCDPELYIPTAFTPNADRINDLFRIPPSSGYQLTSMQVFNRWGQLIFDGKENSTGWDGNYKRNPQPAGLYPYRMEIMAIRSGKKMMKTGTIQLIR